MYKRDYSTLEHLYPDAKGTDYYVMVSCSPCRATLFDNIPICEVRLSDMTVLWQKPNLSSNQKKYISDFKKYLKQQDTYVKLLFCLYFDGDMVDYSENPKSMFTKLYQMLKAAKAGGDPIDVSGCYLTRVPAVVDKNSNVTKYMWDDEDEFFRLKKQGTTIDDILEVVEDTIYNPEKVIRR